MGVINEGRYDSFTRQIVKDIFKYIKETEGMTDNVQHISLPDIDDEGGYYHEHSGIEVFVDVYINRTDEDLYYHDKKIPFYINTYISDDDYIVTEISIDEEFGNKHYEDIFYKLNEDIRHEIEHLIQEIGTSNPRFKEKQQPDIPNTADYDSTYEHHKDPSEVEALVRGFYRRAKLEKKPLNNIMREDLESSIENGEITEEEAQDLYKRWLIYARRNLPDAVYSK